MDEHGNVKEGVEGGKPFEGKAVGVDGKEEGKGEGEEGKEKLPDTSADDVD